VDLREGAPEIEGPVELCAASGRWIGRSPWLLVDEPAVTAFGRATGLPGLGAVPDNQALALAGALVPKVCRVRGRRHALNYGLDDVSFHGHLPIGGRMRVAVRLHEAVERDLEVDAFWFVLAEAASPLRPLLSATMITRYVF
jgi:hypothetical protein